MPKVQTVTVTYGRKTSPKPYESADASVSLGLAFDPEETTEIDDAIADTFDTLMAHVHSRLDIPFEMEERSAPAEEADAPVEEKPKKTKAKAKPKASAPAEESKAADDNTPAEESEAISDGDMHKAVQLRMGSLSKAGVTDGSAKIMALLKEYIDKPPTTPVNIPQEKRAEFLEKLKALGGEE